jgi:hypothetical protein
MATSSGNRYGGPAPLGQQPVVVKKKQRVHCVISVKTPKTTEKKPSAWLHVGASGTEFNSFLQGEF